MRRALERSYPRSGPSVLLEGSVLWVSLGIASSPGQGLGLAEGHRGLSRAQPVTPAGAGGLQGTAEDKFSTI